MNRVYVRTIAVLLIVAFAAMGTLVLTDNFVPQAHAAGDCFEEAVECAIAIADAIIICGGGNEEGCAAAIITVIRECAEAWAACFGNNDDDG